MRIRCFFIISICITISAFSMNTGIYKTSKNDDTWLYDQPEMPLFSNTSKQKLESIAPEHASHTLQEHDPSAPLASLHNFDESCYMNASLQALASQNRFFTSIYPYVDQINAQKQLSEYEQFAYNTMSVIYNMRNHNQASKEELKDLYTRFKKIRPSQDNTNQEDASLFLTTLEDCIEGLCAEHITDTTTWNEFQKQLKQLYAISIQQTISNYNAETTYSNKEIPDTHPLRIGPLDKDVSENTNIQKLLTQISFATEDIEYTTEDNETKQCKKAATITSLPTYLHILLQPYSYTITEDGTFSVKRWNAKIELPEHIFFGSSNNTDNNIIPILHNEQFDNVIIPYQADSIITYSGSGASGHYRAYIRKNKQWYLCNDSLITQHPYPANWRITTSTEIPYIIVYKKQSEDTYSKTPKASPQHRPRTTANFLENTRQEAPSAFQTIYESIALWFSALWG